MARAKGIYLLAVLLLCLSSHAEEHSVARDTERLAELTDHAARTSSRDVTVPRALVARVEKDYDAFLTHLGVINKLPYKRTLLNVRAELKQKREGALHENARVVTPLGGGVVDLAELVTPLRGAFTARIVGSREDGGSLDNMRVFFVSRAKERSISGENYGAGCDKWMEITSFFKKVMKGDGFQLYTADQRYLSVIGGTFVLIGFAKEAIAVGSISFTDSRYPQVMCDQVEKGK